MRIVDGHAVTKGHVWRNINSGALVVIVDPPIETDLIGYRLAISADDRVDFRIHVNNFRIRYQFVRAY